MARKKKAKEPQLTRFLVDGTWDDDTHTISSQVIDAVSADEAERLVCEVYESDAQGYSWRLDSVTTLADRIAMLQELAKPALGEYTQDGIIAEEGLDRCGLCRKVFRPDDESWDDFCPGCADRVSDFMDRKGIDKDSAVEVLSREVQA